MKMENGLKTFVAAACKGQKSFFKKAHNGVMLRIIYMLLLFHCSERK